MNPEINPEAITIDECLDMWKKKDKVTIIKSGQVVGFEKEDCINGNA